MRTSPPLAATVAALGARLGARLGAFGLLGALGVLATAGGAAAQPAKPAAPGVADRDESPRARPTRAGKPGARSKRAPDVTGAVVSGDDVRVCEVAIELGAAGDHVRAGLLVPACERLTGDPAAALADAARQTRIAVSRAATAGDWSKVELVIKTPGATATIDTFPEIPLTSGAWRLPPGTYVVSARTDAGTSSADLRLRDGNRALIVLEPPPPPPPVRTRTVDFTDGEPLPPPHAGPPEVKHESLIPARYRKGLGPAPGKAPAPKARPAPRRK